MIIFTKLKYKNFLSTGNTFTVIDLARSPSTLVVGANGSGKSTMLDAMSFALFGRPHRNINKPQLVNTINNKECIVEIEFTIGKAHERCASAGILNYKLYGVIISHIIVRLEQNWYR